VQVGFFDSGERDFEQILWYCEDEMPPTRLKAECKSL
jgi:hypothetical protein